MPVEFPAYWWGMMSRSPIAPEYSVVSLIQQHILSTDLAGLLWALFARRASALAVAGYYSGAGKTTTLTALTSFYPPGTELVIARGRYEDFDWVAQATPQTTSILVPEFSDHMPAYVWGPAAARVFRLRNQGFTFAGTMHGNGVEDVLAQLVKPPVSLLPNEVAQSLQIILMQNMVEEIGERRVTGVSWVYPNPRGPAGLGVKGLAAWNPQDDVWHLFSSPETWEQLGAWCGLSPEAFRAGVAARTALLNDLLATGVTGFEAVHEQVQAFQAALPAS